MTAYKKVERYLCKNKYLSTEDEKSTTKLSTFPMELLSKLKAFRQETHSYLVPAKDATFELMDAIIFTRKADSLADLSLCPVLCLRHASLTSQMVKRL